jgi:hypothetical protein
MRAHTQPIQSGTFWMSGSISMDRRPESWLRNTEAVLTVGVIVVIAVAYFVARLLGLTN